MMKRLLCVFAHPDDEAFGPGGTIAKCARAGVEVHLLCATKGEAGEWENKFKVGEVRAEELQRSAEILGVKRVEFLGIKDGTICNNLYHDIAAKIMAKIKAFKPQVILTIDRLGVSGHLDHIGISMITTYSFLHTNIANKLYYYCRLKSKIFDRFAHSYFVYFPQGYNPDQITTTVDTKAVWALKVEAIKQHQSQQQDVNRVLLYQQLQPKKEVFILGQTHRFKPRLPETDLFAGF